MANDQGATPTVSSWTDCNAYTVTATGDAAWGLTSAVGTVDQLGVMTVKPAI